MNLPEQKERSISLGMELPLFAGSRMPGNIYNSTRTGTAAKWCHVHGAAPVMFCQCLTSVRRFGYGLRRTQRGFRNCDSSICRRWQQRRICIDALLSSGAM